MQQILTSECIHAVFCLNASTVVLLLFFFVFFCFYSLHTGNVEERKSCLRARWDMERLCTEKETKHQTRQWGNKEQEEKRGREMRGKAECSGSGGGMVRTAKLSKRKAERGVSVRSELSDGWGRDRRREEEILGNETTTTLRVGKISDCLQCNHRRCRPWCGEVTWCPVLANQWECSGWTHAEKKKSTCVPAAKSSKRKSDFPCDKRTHKVFPQFWLIWFDWLLSLSEFLPKFVLTLRHLCLILARNPNKLNRHRTTTYTITQTSDKI